ncbi:hypothetical protein, conserved [Babesia bigemina]|uniref:C3H1-type domain-containing protein n=1 Tax=Babesia bigemina TaxID=5866 RepID=A0A061BR70_BABBI|nr:hypothetical protein, conserved [Babesia bigemina]CDR71943.1 hypothetical protein, conserved [Babesia bigemina]|eukprot:XP_012770885.1 hypothetical protein, conserved [Babesia bigemina]
MTSLDHNNNLCLVTLHSPSSTSCHCPDHVPPRELDKKFDKILNLKNTLNNNPTNILNNLCDGLEKFLGFNKDSKGYDGTGIVYSDLDRLCDGVMGFLSGVLGAVKNENEVTTYDNNVDNIEKLIETLEKNLGNGPQKFTDALSAVSDWLNDYFTQVEKYTVNVTSELQVLKDDKVFAHIRSVAGQGTQNLETQLKAWTTRLPIIFGEVDNIETQHVMKLDNRLKTEIMHETRHIKEAVKMLGDSAAEKEFGSQAKLVDETLIQERNKVDSAIENEHKRVREILQKEFDKLWMEVKNLNRARSTHFQNIIERLNEVETYLNNDFDWQYRKQIENLFTHLKDEMVSIDRTNETAGAKGSKSNLYVKFNELIDTVKVIGDEIGTENTALDKWKHAAMDAILKADVKCEEIVKKLKGERSETGIAGERKAVTNAAEQLKIKADELRGKAYAAKTQIETLVSQALGEVKTMDEALRKNLLEVQNAIKIGMTNYIKENLNAQIKKVLEMETDKIAKKSGGDPPGHLDKIHQGIMKYAERFKTEDDKTGFKGVVAEWLTQLLMSNAVIAKLGEYATGNKGANLETLIIGGVEKLPHHAKAIVALLHAEIKTAVQFFDQTILVAGDKEIGRHVDAVQQVCEKFSKALEEKIASGNFADIEGVINAALQKTSNVKSFLLQPTVRYILYQLVGAARQAGWEVLSFTGEYGDEDHTDDSGYKLVNNLTDATKAVRELGETLHGQLKQAGIAKTKFADINTQIANEVNPQFGMESSSKISKFADSKFIGYLNSVNIPDGTNPLRGTEGALPIKIKAIETIKDGEHYLRDVEQGENAGETKFHDKTFNNLLSFVTGNLNKFTEAIEKLVNGGGVSNSDLEDYITRLKNMLNNDAETYYGASITGFTKIRTDLGKLQSRIVQATSTDAAKQELDIIIQKLEELPNAVDRQKDVALKHVGELRRSLEQQITFIRQAVETADYELKESIKTVRTTLKEAHENNKLAASHLRTTLLDTTKRGFEEITLQVQSFFAEQKMADLAALQKLIDRQLQKVKRIIKMDLQTGLKGFLKTLQCGSTKVATNKNIKLLTDFASSMSPPSDHNSSHLKHLAEAFHDFCHPLHTYLLTEITRANLNNSGTANYSDRLKSIIAAFDTLLPHLREQNKYDHQVPSMLSDLRAAVTALKPDGFSSPNSATLDCITSGLTKFAHELDKAYVSVYDGQGFEGKVVEETGAQVVYTTGAYPVYLSTDYGKKCAKVFCTALEIMFHDLSELREECKRDWKDLNICMHPGEDIENALASYLKNCGYGVPSKQGVQDGELRYGESWTGQQIHETLLTKEHGATLRRTAFKLVSDDDEKKDGASVPKYSVLKQLIDYLIRFYQVCHYDAATSTKYPSSIYQMLTWLSGLPHSTVYDKLYLNGFAELFEKKDKETGDGEGGITFEIEGDGSDGSSIPIKTNDDNKLEAYPVTITPAGLSDILAAVCSGAHDVLTSVLGHGHAGGRYAFDFNTNPDKFTYPADMVTLACWLYDILRRVHHQLYFLYQQCYYKTERNGWAECYYGRYVAGSSWQCNKMQCPDQRCEQKCKQTCNQIHNQKGDQHPNCGLKSPLQSFLEDGLQGFLPHHVKFEKGKLECSVKGHFNLPCKTPMGFGNISDVASHTQRGRHIYEALKRLCGDERSPLPKLCGQLSCLLPSAPKTLDDMFGFYYRLLRGWDDDNTGRKEHRETAFRAAVNAANFEDSSTELDVNNIFKSINHGSKKNMPHLTGDLYALIDCYTDSSSAASHPCGRYLRPICHDMCGTFTKENADKYLSWIVYCTETFLQLLKQLYEECAKNCDGERPKCRVSRCKDACTANKLPMAAGSAHNESCGSIVNCKFMRPTFYKYGLVLGDCSSLSADSTKRTCIDLCIVLKSVTNEKEVDGHPLAKLVHVTIPQFIFTIRAPFIWTTLALWLLSFLYLIHIMVIRLDLLHIKSHLHSPSSHRIVAQSLLAAARVNKLNRVFYLQP